MPSRFVLVSVLVSLTVSIASGSLIVEPVHRRNKTVPAIPLETDSQSCRLDLSEELFGGVNEACGRNLDRSRCCPVLAAWLFAAHARYALQIPNATDGFSGTVAEALPVMPDDSQKCVNLLQSALESKKVKLPQPNATCDTVLCFCGIRLHHITSLNCPAAFNVTYGVQSAAPTAAVRNLEKSCRNSSYPGCTKCLGAVRKLKNTNTTSKSRTTEYWEERATKMFDRDCQLMGLTWLLARNKTAYIPTVSAVLRAIMYTSHSQQDSRCSPDQENMPLAVDSLLQLQKAQSAGSSHLSLTRLPLTFLFALLILSAL